MGDSGGGGTSPAYQTYVRYGQMRYLGTFRSPTDSYRRGERVVIRSGRGVEVGVVLSPPKPLDGPDSMEITGDILRACSSEDVHRVDLLDDMGKTKAFRFAKDRIRALSLPMKVSMVEHLLGGEKVVVYFRSDVRVDFRSLVRDLSQEFQTRVVMKQIGARDEARLLGDWNDCGRELCCRTHLQHLEPIPMKMAKSQKTTLDPAKISGRCGRLKCCLRYEHDTYVEFRKRLPRHGQRVRTKDGTAEVVASDVLSQTVTVEYSSGARVHLRTADVLPLEREGAPRSVGHDLDRHFYATIPLFNIETPITLTAIYAGLAADVLTRYHHSLGREVHLLTGIKDHHRATQRGMGSEASLLSRGERYQHELEEVWGSFSVAPSQVFRTGAEIHKRTVSDFFKKLRKNDDIYKKSFQGWHCTGCHVSFTGEDLGKVPCVYCGSLLEKIDEESYFFRLPNYEKRLLAHLKTHEEFIRPRIVKLDIESRAKNGLGDVLVARSSFDYGIGIPGDPGYIVSGWFEGLLAYVSALADGQENPLFRAYWPANVHFATKVNLWIHGVIWPAMLLAGGLELPDRIVACGEWLAPDPLDPDRRGVLTREELKDLEPEALRYYLLHEIPFGLSGTFLREDFEKVLQRDLAGSLRGTVDGILGLVQDRFGGRIPDPGGATEPDEEIRTSILNLEKTVGAEIEDLQFSAALGALLETLHALGRGVEDLRSSEDRKGGERQDRLAASTYHLLEALRLVAHYLHPLLPRTAREILAQISTDVEPRFIPEERTWGRLSVGTRISPVPPAIARSPSISTSRPDLPDESFSPPGHVEAPPPDSQPFPPDSQAP